MNQLFNKALYLLDSGEYEKGEEELKKAIQTSADDLYELVEIKACYAELLYQTNRYDEAMVLIEEVLDSGDEYSFCEEKDMVKEIKQQMILEEQV